MFPLSCHWGLKLWQPAYKRRYANRSPRSCDHDPAAEAMQQIRCRPILMRLRTNGSADADEQAPPA